MEIHNINILTENPAAMASKTTSKLTIPTSSITDKALLNTPISIDSKEKRDANSIAPLFDKGTTTTV